MVGFEEDFPVTINCGKIQAQSILFNLLVVDEENLLMLYDLIGALLSLLSTYFFVRVDGKAWPIGLLATCFNGWLYWHKGIYADTCLETFYFLSIGYGWYRWSGPQQQQLTLIKRLSTRQWLCLGIAIFALYIIILKSLTMFSNSSIAKIDALTTALSLAAQWLMCHKIIATWILWFITDALYALMYLHKALTFHTLLMLVYTGIAVSGYVCWLKQSRQIMITTTLTPSNQPGCEPRV